MPRIGIWLAWAACAALASSGASAQIVRDGLIGYWSFDDVEGKTVRDAVGGQHAELMGNAKISPGKMGNGVLLDGAHATYVQISDNFAAMKLPKEQIAVECWVYSEQFIEWGAYVSMFQDNGSNEYGWVLGENFGMTWAISTEKPNDGNGVLDYLKAPSAAAKQWTHLVGVYDGKRQMIYVNGKQDALLETHSGPINYPANGWLMIGVYKDDNEHFPHKGMIDEVRLYERALTEAEIQRNMNATGLAVEAAGKLSASWGIIKRSR